MFHAKLWYIAVDYSEMKLPSQLYSDLAQGQQAF